MNGFLSNLVARHTGAENKVLPRLRGKFELYAGPGAAQEEDTGVHEQVSKAPAKRVESSLHQPVAHDPLQPPVQAMQPPAPTAAINDQPENKKADDPVRQVVVPRAAIVNNAIAEKPAMPVAPAAASMNEHTIQPLIQNEITHHQTIMQPSQVINQVIMPAVQEEAFQPSTFNALPNEPVPPAMPVNNQMPVDQSWLQQLRNAMSNAWPIADAKEETQPVIKVNIGRIDVRAVTQPQAASKASSHPKPGMSLEDFLKNKKSTSA